MSPPTNHYR